MSAKQAEQTPLAGNASLGCPRPDIGADVKIPSAAERKAAAVAAVAAVVPIDEAAVARAQAAVVDRTWAQIVRWATSTNTAGHFRHMTTQTSCRVSVAPIRDHSIIDKWKTDLEALGYIVTQDRHMLTVSIP